MKRLLRNSPAVHVWSPSKVAIVTGLSDPNSCQLTASQQWFLASLGNEEIVRVSTNFPFLYSTSNCLSDNVLAVPGLIRASFWNAKQFAISKMLAKLARPHWSALLASTDRLFLITGSCGLQLACDGLAGISASAKVAVIGLGPVATRRTLAETKLPISLVCGAKDLIARRFCPDPDHVIPGAGHLDYWNREDVQEVVRTWISSRIFKS